MRKYMLILIAVLIITLTGCNIKFTAVINPSVDTVEVGTEWVDTGCTSTVGTCTTIDGSVDVNTVGEYHIEYLAVNEKEEIQLLRVVFVVDNIAPVLHLNSGIDTIGIDEVWIDGGCIANDNYDAEVTCNISNNTIDSSSPGVYVVTYQAIDTNGNTAEINRVVVVE